MIKAILDFLQIQREMIFGYVAILIQDRFGITPNPFNAITMILRQPDPQRFGMIHRMRMTIAF